MKREFEYVDRIIKQSFYNAEPIDFDLPKRATKNSMAYDIYSPEKFILLPKEKYMVKTGINVKMGENEGLILNVRSSMGKKGIMLANTSGWIDSDFFPNEIGLLFYNYGEEAWTVEKNDRIAQAMFIQFLTTDNDTTTDERNGGWGSTNM